MKKNILFNKTLILGSLAIPAGITTYLCLKTNNKNQKDTGFKVSQKNLGWMTTYNQKYKNPYFIFSELTGGDSVLNTDFFPDLLENSKNNSKFRRLPFSTEVYEKTPEFKLSNTKEITIKPLESTSISTRYGWIYDTSGWKDFKLSSPAFKHYRQIYLYPDDKNYQYIWKTNFANFSKKNPDFWINLKSNHGDISTFEEVPFHNKSKTEPFKKYGGHFKWYKFNDLSFDLYSMKQIYDAIGGDRWKQIAVWKINGNKGDGVVLDKSEIYDAILMSVEFKLKYSGEDMRGPWNVRTILKDLHNVRIKVKYAYKAMIRKSRDINLWYKVPTLDKNVNYTQDQLRNFIEIYDENQKEFNNLKLKNISFDPVAKKIYYYEDFDHQTISFEGKNYGLVSDYGKKRSIDVNVTDIDFFDF